MKKYNVKKVFFSTSDGTIDQINISEYNLDNAHISHGLRLTIKNMTYVNQIMIIGKVIKDYG